MGPSRLERLFNPRSIAVFGASESGRSVGSMVFANLVDGAFQGTLYPINPKHREVRGIRCHASVREVDENIDLAVIATPAATVPGIIRQCGKAGIRNAVICSAGFGESGGNGDALDRELKEAAREAGIRFIGPNCVGLVRPWLNMNATFLNSVTPKGNLALVSQSGALCSAISDLAAPHDLGFSALVSLGNSADTGFGDVLKFLANDPKTSAILLYVEGVRHPRSFISAMRLATRVKPVIVLKAGRHNTSAEAAHTHTGALIGSDRVFDAVLERAGAVRVDTFGQLFAAAEVLSGRRTRVTGNRLAVITNGGGAGVLAADRAGDLHISLPSPSPETIADLDGKLSPYWSKSNPIDILGDAKPEAYGEAVKAAISDPNYDGVLVMLTPQAMTDATAAAQATIDAVPKGNRKPVLSCWMGETSVATARKMLSSSGVPDFQVPEQGVEAFAYIARHERNTRLALEVPGPLREEHQPDIEAARAIIAGARSEDRLTLTGPESKQLLDAFGIPVNRMMKAASEEEVKAACQAIGFPVVVKIDSPDISHKSDVGGVRLNIKNERAAITAFGEVIENARSAVPDADIHGVTIERLARLENARELVIGMSTDPVFGPTILFGAGGTMVEVLQDSAVALPPLNALLADRLIHRTKVSRLLEAYRDQKAVDRGAIIDILLRLSDLVCELPEIREVEMNPLLAGPAGAVAVDARVRLNSAAETSTAAGRMAIKPYPRHLVEETTLRNGTKMTIRPIRPDDAYREREFVRRLSAKTKQYRFMHTIEELTPAMLAQFTQIDYDREMALVAVTEDADGELTQQGVARYIVNPDDTSCEFAIVVSDDLQHQGVGTRLMKALIAAAKSHGLKRIEGTGVAENYAMLDLMQSLGFHAVPSSEDRALIEVSLGI